jgi:DNA-binding HxlR family transcriptional regulator
MQIGEPASGGQYDSPAAFSLEILSGKWKPAILTKLGEGPQRYANIRRSIPAVSDKMLSQCLRSLEAKGLIVLLYNPQKPAQREYCLTERAEALMPLLQALSEWGAQARREMRVEFSRAAG